MSENMIIRRTGKTTVEPNNIVATLVSIGLLLFAFYLIFNVVKAFEISQQKVAVLQSAKKEVENLRIKNIQLVMEKDSVETLDYIETEARDRLNYAKKGEIVFVITDLAWQSAASKVEDILNPKSQGDDVPVVKQWVEFLF